jgi:UPF0755 protein
MNIKYKKYLIVTLLVGALLSGFFYFRNQVYFSHGSLEGNKNFEIIKGEGNAEIGESLEKEKLISNKIYFYLYLKMHNLQSKVMPGMYSLSSGMTIPEIIHIITNPKDQFIKITFPEGFTARQMAQKLTANNLPGEDFLHIVSNPEKFKKRYSYLTGESVRTLEGYLFPDTYFFKQDVSAENIVGRLLDTFDEKLSVQMREDIAQENRSIEEIIIMASIIEKEVQTAEDMKIASGIFWGRLASGQRLQSDAPLSYILEDTNDQHSGSDLELDSPYNTYKYAGLPPSAISNPGLTAIFGAIYPTASNYNFFLTVTIDGEKKVIYSRTFQEHVANRQKYGI